MNQSSGLKTGRLLKRNVFKRLLEPDWQLLSRPNVCRHCSRWQNERHQRL